MAKNKENPEPIEARFRKGMLMAVFSNYVTAISSGLVALMFLLGFVLRLARGRLLPVFIISIAAVVSFVFYRVRQMQKDENLRQTVALSMLYHQYDLEKINDETVRKTMDQALQIRAQICLAIIDREQSLVTDQIVGIVDNMDALLKKIYSYARKVDRLTDHEEFIKTLSAKVGQAHFSAALDSFERMRQNLVNNVDELGVIYTQILQLETDSTNYTLESRIATSVSEQAYRMQDLLDAMTEVSTNKL